MIAKDGSILSVTEKKDKPKHPRTIEATKGAKFPDVIFVNADSIEEATSEVQKVIKKWETDNEQKIN